MTAKTRAQLDSEIAELLASNTQGEITAADLRAVLDDITDSTFMPLSDTPLPVANGGTGAITASAARTSLGIGTAGTHPDSFFLQTANNLSDVVAATARTNLGLGTAATQNTGTFLQTANNLSDVVAATARTNLGLGTIATQNASAVAITGGSVTGITDLAIADGGTGASTAAAALVNLGINTITTNTTITYGPAGTYSTLALAVAYLNGFNIAAGVTVTLAGTTGAHNYTAGVIFNHPQGAQVVITSAGSLTTYTLVPGSLAITNNGPRDHDVVIELTSVSGLTTGDWVNIRNTAGTGEFSSLSGPQQITNVNGGTNKITVKCKDVTATITATTLSAAVIERIPTVLNFTGLGSGGTALYIGDYATLGSLDNIIIVGDVGVNLSIGVVVGYGSCLNIDQGFAIANFGRTNLWLFEESICEAVDFSTSGAGTAGVAVSGRSSFVGLRSNISGCTYGATNNAGYIDFSSTEIGGCNRGIYNSDDAYTIHSGTISGCDVGAAVATTGSFIALSGSTLSYNDTGTIINTGGRILTDTMTYTSNTVNNGQPLNTIYGYNRTRVVTAAGAVTVSNTDDNVVIVNKTAGAATVVNLPASPPAGLEYVIKDGKGDAAANNITITPSTGNIDGGATNVINTNYGSRRIIYNGTIWNVI